MSFRVAVPVWSIFITGMVLFFFQSPNKVETKPQKHSACLMWIDRRYSAQARFDNALQYVPMCQAWFTPRCERVFFDYLQYMGDLRELDEHPACIQDGRLK